MILIFSNPHLSRSRLSDFLSFERETNGWGKRVQKFSTETGSFGSIWNWQLEQHAALKRSELLLKFPKLLELSRSDLLSGLLQIGQNDSDEIDSLGLRLYLFWRLRVAKGTLESLISGILLKWNGVSFPAVLTIVLCREGFSSWTTKVIIIQRITNSSKEASR